MSQHKALALHVKAALAADDAALAKIRQYTLRDFTPDELQLREYVLAHNCIDRDNECFDEALLDNFATTLLGKGVYVTHPTSWRSDGGPAEGKVFDTRTEMMSLADARALLNEPNLQLPPDRTQVKVLYASAYYARTEDNASLLIKQDAGIAGDVSIGFTAPSPQPIYDNDNRQLTAVRWPAPGQALEMSLVWLGAQQGARAVKNARHQSNPEHTMELTKEQIDALKEKAANNEKAAISLAALKTALGDNATLLDDPASLARLVTDGKSYKASLVDDIVGMERQLKITGDDEPSVSASKEFLSAMPVDRLVAMQKGLEARLPTNHGIKGANPNPPPAGSQEAPADSPINNPAFSA
ncbi:hypothetical protein [Dyella amyloliquefaciens]|uniref:hypothetical protein n=1 Tax=Dyella amyloliquefaciens TaxID=1770545 RepID=UPI00102E4CF9|nr:hypothetical protein [Dyella amyloliquefaciens]